LSGFIVHKTPSRFAPVEQSLAKLCFVPWTRSRKVAAGSFEFGVTWLGDSPAPVCSEPELGVSAVMLGRLYGPDEVRLDRNLLRLAVAYKKNGVSELTRFSGMGAVVLFDHSLDTCFIVTDRMGFFPLFVAFPDEPEETAVGTHADILAASYRRPLAEDELSMVEFLSAGSATPPHTYYRDVHQLEAGSVYRWDESGFRKERVYWEAEPDPDWSASVDRLAGRLADAIRHAVRVRLGNAGGRTGLLLSGGLDSRSLLFSSENPRDEFITITFCNRINREARFARMLAQLAGAERSTLMRDFEYYGRIAVRAVQLSSGMWNYSHAHTLGFTEEIHRLSPHLTISGLYFDLLFRGMAVEYVPQKRRLRAPGKARPDSVNLAWYHGKNYSFEASPVWDAVRARMWRFYDGLKTENMTDLDRMRVEFRRLRCISSGPGVVFPKTLLRTVPFDLVAADAGVIEVFRTIPPAVKLDAGFFPKVVKKISQRAMTVRDAKTGYRFEENSLAGAVDVAYHKLVRRARRAIGIEVPRRLATETSWIDWYYYVCNSAVLRELWGEVRRTCAERIADLLGYDPFGESMEVLARDYPLFRRMLTLGLWHKYRIR